MTNFGDTLRSATRVRLQSGTSSFSGSIGGTNADDFLRVNLRDPQRLTLKLSRSRASLELIKDKNNNNRLDPGEILASSRASGQVAEQVRLNRLDAGVYYIRVSSDGTGTSRYTLSATVDRARNLSRPEQIWMSVNRERERRGIPALALNTQLSSAARTHSKNMAIQDFFSHTDHLGTSHRDRILAARYSPLFSGENIAAGRSGARDTMSQWMNSPGHQANILNINYTEIGVGYHHLSNDTGSINYNHYWTQKFGRY
jgi:uncharacterized protein YkwD